MYAQVEKSKENKSRVVANSFAQKKNDVKQGFGFVDNRPETIAQRKLKAVITNQRRPFTMRTGVMDSISRMLAPSPISTKNSIQLMKVTMPDGKVVDTDYMNNTELDEAMKMYMTAISSTHWASPILKSYEANYHKLSQALLQRKSGKHLLLGEGDFGFSHSLSKKQQTSFSDMPQMLATELRERSKLEEEYPQTFPQNVGQVEKFGGDVKFGVNGMEMDESFSSGSHFPIVTTMFPNTGSRNRKTQGPLTHDVVGGIFSGSSEFQEPGDQLVLTVPKQYSSSTRHRTYGMQKHAPEKGYTLMNKFGFDPERHPPYEHKMTKKDKSASSMETGNKGVSYVFVKAPKEMELSYDSDFETDEEPDNIYDARIRPKKKKLK